MKMLAAFSVFSVIVTSFLFSNFMPSNAIQVAPIEASMLSPYNLEFTDAGYKIYGNNLFSNNETKQLADVDTQELTTNSSSIGLPDNLKFSDALLIYAVNSTSLNASGDASNVLLSKDGVNYTSKRLNTFGSVNNYTIGIAVLDAENIANTSNLFVSLPLLEDTENFSSINMAGWYLILLDSSGEFISNFSLNASGSGDSSLALSFVEGNISGIAKPGARNPNSNFTKLGDIASGESAQGNFGVAENGFLYINTSETKIARPTIRIEKILEQSKTNPNDSFEMSVRLPNQIRNSNFKVSINSQYNYIPNTVLIPAGFELSGPLTDASGDDAFSYNNGIMLFNFNSGLYQLNKLNKTSIRFLMNSPDFNQNIKAEIEYIDSFGKSRISKSNNINFSFSQYWQDVILSGKVESLSLTKAKIELSVFSNSYLGKSGRLSFKLPEFVAISESTLKHNECSYEKASDIICAIEIKSGITQINLDILPRRELEQIFFHPISLEIVGEFADPNYNNNTVNLKGRNSDR